MEHIYSVIPLLEDHFEERFGIIWRTVTDMNPHVIFD